MFDTLFGKKTQHSHATSKDASNDSRKVGVRYNPDLLADLKSDHVLLVDLFKQVYANATLRDSYMLHARLEKIHTVLVEHLLKENVFFYVYLKNQLPANSSLLAKSQTFSREMPKIGNTVTDFIKRYSMVKQWDANLWTTFESELSAIISTLTQRVLAEEESLYPLYLSPEEYSLINLDPA